MSQSLYAIVGDIHSSICDFENVLVHIKKVAPTAQLIGTGDLFECTISKKRLPLPAPLPLEEVMLNPPGFEKLLQFPSVRGNQEERILEVTTAQDFLRNQLQQFPETITIGDAIVIHGHQWEWGGHPWALVRPDVQAVVTFYGHSHKSGLIRNGRIEQFDWHTPISITDGTILVNVGAVIQQQEWVLYDAANKTVTFMSTKR